MKRLVYIVTALFGFSCASENQQQGLDKIAQHYGAETSFSKGFSTNSGKTTTKFTINVGESELLNSLRPELAASNIALMLYESFDEKEREKYTHIEVKMAKDSASKDKGRLYIPSFLDDGLDQAAIFTNFSDNLLAKDYWSIANNIKPEYQSPNLAGDLSNFMGRLYDAHGTIEGYKRVEFGVFTKKNGEKLFHYAGELKFSDGFIRPYIVTTSMQVDNDNIAGYTLDF